MKRKQKAGKVYFSADICRELERDPVYMRELFETAATLSRRGGLTNNELLGVIPDLDGLTGYHFTSSHGRIIIGSDGETGDLYIIKAPELNSEEAISFTELQNIHLEGKDSPAEGF